MTDRFELPAELNIYGALETRDALMGWCAAQSAKGAAHLEVSARDVAEVDGSGLQLLAALSNMEQSWRLVDASAVFMDACRTLGFGHWLDARYLPSSAVKA
jgi:ABC-type transporter Mla MlaB component